MAKAVTQKEREILKQPVTLGDQIFERKREVEQPAEVSPKSKIKASPPSEKAKSKAAPKPRTSRASGSNDPIRYADNDEQEGYVNLQNMGEEINFTWENVKAALDHLYLLNLIPSEHDRTYYEMKSKGGNGNWSEIDRLTNQIDKNHEKDIIKGIYRKLVYDPYRRMVEASKPEGEQPKAKSKATAKSKPKANPKAKSTGKWVIKQQQKNYI